MKQLSLAVAAASILALAGCGSSSSGGTSNPGFTQPANTIIVNFSVDDSLNKNWKAGELEWKGMVQMDKTTRLGSIDSTWLSADPGWALLYDDGPWDTYNETTKAPGHEPLGSVAGDNKWGVTVFFPKPAADLTNIGYGLRDATNPDRTNGGWVWIGPNGNISIKTTDTVVNAPGITFPAHGTTDLKLVVTKTALAAGFDPTTITVKGSAWGWVEKAPYDDGTHGDATANDGKYTFLLSNVVDGTKPPYPGLLKSGDQPQFVFVIGGVEYKAATGNKQALSTGITAQYKTATGAWTDVAITNQTTGDFNTLVTIP